LDREQNKDVAAQRSQRRPEAGEHKERAHDQNLGQLQSGNIGVQNF
jgi:hypothetical protein